jgi:hypothetical protein
VEPAQHASLWIALLALQVTMCAGVPCAPGYHVRRVTMCAGVQCAPGYHARRVDMRPGLPRAPGHRAPQHTRPLPMPHPQYNKVSGPAAYTVQLFQCTCGVLHLTSPVLGARRSAPHSPLASSKAACGSSSMGGMASPPVRRSTGAKSRCDWRARTSHFALTPVLHCWRRRRTGKAVAQAHDYM